MGKIHLLPSAVAELIAAGEVIDRPASIVKELVENSLDAGADRITVEISRGGITFLQVSDNGCGISPEDLPLAFVRHATSKIASASDLDAILTLGFRGEALPSIAAVSRICVTTRTAESPVGFRYAMEGGVEGSLEEVGCAVGTVFSVRDLFYNTPARMKFLKKDVTEANAVASLLDRLALANPAVSFTLLRDGKKVLQTPGDGSLLSAARIVCGGPVAAAMLPVDSEQEGIRVRGLIARPSVARQTRSMQTFFINSRYVRSKTCVGAVEEAYKNRLMSGRFPACILDLQIDSSQVDVNVHPAKLEVRFSSERAVYNAVYSACLEALSQGERPAARPRPAVTGFSLRDFDYSDRQTKLEPLPTLPKKQGVPDGSVLTLRDGTDAFFQKPKPFSSRGVSIDIERLPGEEEPGAAREKTPAALEQAPPDRRQRAPAQAIPSPGGEEPGAAHEKAPAALEEVPPDRRQRAPAQAIPSPGGEGRPEKPLPEDYRIIGEVFRTYILVEQGGTLLLIDQHAAHERALYNRIAHLSEDAPVRQIQTPQPVTLSREEYAALSECPEALSAIGVVAEEFGDRTFLVREVPMLLTGVPLDDLLGEAARRVMECRARMTPEALDELLYSVACKAAVKAGRRLDPSEQAKIVEMVLGEDGVRHCPHGRPVVVAMTRQELDRMFGRIGQ